MLSLEFLLDFLNIIIVSTQRGDYIKWKEKWMGIIRMNIMEMMRRQNVYIENSLLDS